MQNLLYTPVLKKIIRNEVNKKLEVIKAKPNIFKISAQNLSMSTSKIKRRIDNAVYFKSCIKIAIGRKLLQRITNIEFILFFFNFCLLFFASLLSFIGLAATETVRGLKGSFSNSFSVFPISVVHFQLSKCQFHSKQLFS